MRKGKEKVTILWLSQSIRRNIFKTYFLDKNHFPSNKKQHQHPTKPVKQPIHNSCLNKRKRGLAAMRTGPV